MRKSLANTYDDAAGVDLNPMLDVVFILLIFFIVTASFINEKSLPIRDTPNNTQSQSEYSAIQIRITGANEVFLDGRRVQMSAVKALLSQRYAEDQEHTALQINAHESSVTDTYIFVLDAAQQANIQTVSLTTFSD